MRDSSLVTVEAYLKTPYDPNVEFVDTVAAADGSVELTRSEIFAA